MIYVGWKCPKCGRWQASSSNARSKEEIRLRCKFCGSVRKGWVWDKKVGLRQNVEIVYLGRNNNEVTERVKLAKKRGI